MSKVEQRRHERARVDIVVSWGRSAECYEMDRITSFSAGGCFLQTERPAGRGAEVFVKFWVPEERTIRCAVRYLMEGIGMGLEFKDLSDGERQVLGGLADDYRRAFAQ